VFKVEYRLMPGMGYISIVHCGGRQVTLNIATAKTGSWLWKYPILAGAAYRDDFAVNIAIPPEIAEGVGIAECTRGIITIPPREYLFAVADNRRDYERFINSEEDNVEKEGGIVKKVVTASGWSLV
jgi:hypothetical protein